MDLISVIIPVYNTKKYLEQCIKSTLSQTYDNIEIILVDDGSTDGSGDICDKYAMENSNIQVVHKLNAGLGMARNTGLELVNGTYVAFLDSDDYISPHMIENLYKKILEENVSVCKTGFMRFSDELHYMEKGTNYIERIYRGEEVRNIYLPLMLGSAPEKSDSIEMCVWGTLYHVLPIKEFMIRFPSERELISEDVVFNIEYMQHIEGVSILNTNDYYYRINGSSLTHKYRIDRFNACKDLYLYEENRLCELGYLDDVINRCRRQFFVNLKVCIKQENTTVSNKTIKAALYQIKAICKDKLVRDIIDKYPVNKMGLRQRSFIWMIKHKMAICLYLITNTKYL